MRGRLSTLDLTSNGLADLRQVSGAKVAVASFVTDADRWQAQRLVRWCLVTMRRRLPIHPSHPGFPCHVFAEFGSVASWICTNLHRSRSA